MDESTAEFDERYLIRKLGFRNSAVYYERVELAAEYPSARLPSVASLHCLPEGSLYLLMPSIFDIQFETVEQGWLSTRVVSKQRPLAHWFDAIPMLARFEFEAEMTGSFKVWFQNRLVGKGVLEEWKRAKGKIPNSHSRPIAQALLLTPEGSDDGLASHLQSLKNAASKLLHGLRPVEPDWAAPSSSIIGGFPLGKYRGDDDHLLLHQTGMRLVLEIDPISLESRHIFSYAHLHDNFKGTPCAKPLFDPKSNEIINVVTSFDLPYAKYRVVALRKDALGDLGRTLATFLAKPTVVYSFAITPRYVVVPVYPLMFKKELPKGLQSGRQVSGLYEKLVWDDGQDTLFYVVDRQKEQLVAVYRSEAAFSFHVINAFEADQCIFVDLAAYEDPAIMSHLKLASLRSNESLNEHMPLSYIRRYCLPRIAEEAARFDGAAGQLPAFPLASFTNLREFIIECPIIPENAVGQPYRHVYGLSVSREDRAKSGVLWNTLVRYDMAHPLASCVWSQPGCFPSMPVFVPARKKSETQELASTSLYRDVTLKMEKMTDGWLMAIVLNVLSNKSFLLVLDAIDLREIARFILPNPVPMGWAQGTWIDFGHESEVARLSAEPKCEND